MRWGAKALTPQEVIETRLEAIAERRLALTRPSNEDFYPQIRMEIHRYESEILVARNRVEIGLTEPYNP